MSGREEYINQVTLGIQPENVEIQLLEYDPHWSVLFEHEKARISQALGTKALQINHVGSTAVPGLCAKPIIDILLVVHDSSDEAAYMPEMEAAGYILRIREPKWYQHRMFKGPDTDINLHVFSNGEAEIGRMLHFRDWLINCDADREFYANTKRKLARQKWKYVQHYADAKSEVVKEIMNRAFSNGK